MTAIGLLQVMDNITELGLAAANFPSGMVGGIQIGFRKTIILQIECGEVFATGANRVGFCEKMPPFPVAIDQVKDLEFLIKCE